MRDPKVVTFFYGSYINPEVLREVDLVPERIYTHAQDVLGGVYLPRAVLAHTLSGQTEPALCYIAPSLEPAPASPDYVDRILEPARRYGFPPWYLERLESFVPR